MVVLDLLQDRETCLRPFCRRRCLSYARGKIPSVFKCSTFIPVQQLPTHGKIFASQWLNSDQILTGGKQNDLLLWDIKSKKPTTITVPPISFTDIPEESCGIHSISLSPSGYQIATGSYNPSEIVILDTNTLEARKILHGHMDWVFATAFISENLLISGSRDSTVKLWNTTVEESTDPISHSEALITRNEHDGKVRELKYDHVLQLLATLSMDGTVKIWNIKNLDVIRVLPLDYMQEYLCLALCQHTHLLAYGGDRTVRIYSLAEMVMVEEIELLTTDVIRSMSFEFGILTIATSKGDITFYNFPERKWVNTSNTKDGYVLSVSENPSIFSHQWEPNGGRLFTGGGSLYMGDPSSYAAVWS